MPKKQSNNQNVVKINQKMVNINRKGVKSDMANVSQNWLESIKLLEVFTRDYHRFITGSEAAKFLKLPQRTASRKLNLLLELGFLKYKSIGKNKLFYMPSNRLTTIHLINIAEHYKSLQFFLKYPHLKNTMIDIHNHIADNLIVFGSYAKGYTVKDSDLDMVLFTKETNETKLALSKYPLKISPHFISFNEFEILLKKKQALSIEIAKDHIFFGDVSRLVTLFARCNHGSY